MDQDDRLLPKEQFDLGTHHLILIEDYKIQQQIVVAMGCDGNCFQCNYKPYFFIIYFMESPFSSNITSQKLF